MKSAILGGSFDPVHNGHLMVAEWIRVGLELDRIYFVPCNIPPHKQRKKLSLAGHRARMIELAVRSNPDFFYSDFELRRPGISYTVDTCLYFRNNLLRKEDKLYLIVGYDNFLEFDTWKDYPLILKNAGIIVVVRPGFDHPEARDSVLEKLSEYRPEIFFADNPRIEISSTMIRERVGAGASIRYLVPDEVREYIETYGLYKK